MRSTSHLARYCHELGTVRDAAANTIRAYSHALSAFGTWLTPRGRALASATRDDVIAYREHLSDKAPQTVAQFLKAARSFYAFALDATLVTASPVPAAMRVALKRQTPTTVPTAAQFLGMRARAAARTEWRPREFRGGAVLLEALAGTGLRVGALLTARVQNLVLHDKPYVMVDAASMACKGIRANRVPITPHAAALLAAWVAGKPPDALLFDLSERSVRDVVTRAAPPDLPGVCPHSLRHFYVSMMYRRNLDGGTFDVVWARDAAGHSSIAVTDGYLSMARTVCASDAEWEAWAYGQSGTKSEVGAAQVLGGAVGIAAA
mgnify:CR=1 FL=1